MYFTVESAGEYPRYTFTSISTGRPVSYVEWGTDSDDQDWIDIPGRKDKVLDDPATAQYTITLTVDELELGMFYFCDIHPFYKVRELYIEGKRTHNQKMVYRVDGALDAVCECQDSAQ